MEMPKDHWKSDLDIPLDVDERYDVRGYFSKQPRTIINQTSPASDLESNKQK